MHKHTYTIDTPEAYDEAALVHDFTNAHLLSISRKFFEAQCLGHPLARLTISPDDWDLSTALNTAPLPETDPTQTVRNGWFRFELDNPQVAQLWCFGHQATLAIRQKDGRITKYQVNGDHDARAWVIKGVALTFVGVNVRIKRVASGTGHPTTDEVSLYVCSRELPPLEVVESIHDRLEAELGTPTSLFLRTDPFFVQYNGPAWDIFEGSLPAGSAVRFLDEPHIICAPRFAGRTCLRVTSPPTLPMGEWPQLRNEK